MTTAESVPERTGTVAGGIETDRSVTRKDLRLNRDPARVIAKLFVPGSYGPEMSARAAGVVHRVLALSDADAEAAYARTIDGFNGRHRGLEAVFAENFSVIAHRVDHDIDLSGLRKLLVGALFTQEYAIEGAAFTNPSMIPHPDQDGLGPGQLRFVMSARSIGEGNLSCTEFRTGVLGQDGHLTVDEPSPYAHVGRVQQTLYERSTLRAALDGAADDDDEVVAFLLHHLPERFSDADLEACLGQLPPQLLVLERTHRTFSRIHWFVACHYTICFADDADVSERVLWPLSPTERKGIEDARFVRCTDDDGRELYRGTYTAYNGTQAVTQLMETSDFRTFRMAQMFGATVADKGMALFPCQVGGRYLALSGQGRNGSAIVSSADGRVWSHPQRLKMPEQPWALTYVGNCGSPIKTDAGWLVLTYGIGPMRVYALGAVLLDLEEPTRVIGALPDPLVVAAQEERDAYVPNVVYSCGAMKYQDTLVIPYGIGDMGIEFATVPVSGLLDRMVGK
ncbi:MAG: hypothetical protein AUG49_19460 [Catenulispora sp. 13_1_20CM_3_70_7]|nr:hypothetical protein [Catenulisporales bacterium]OLE22333.1 MAG: hypothetical protein AUG49_19460 [Catenulispora sp. 13_1_20CM_3_70_7]